MPCLNEELTIGNCIKRAQEFIDRANINAEILVSDNGSTDSSVDIAQALGARVVITEAKGYGAALINGIESALGKYVIMADSDMSYDFSRLDDFIEQLRLGADLVVGNRFNGGIEPKAMPFLHKYIGNPVLSYIGRLLYKTPVKDFHCGIRGIKRSSFKNGFLNCEGMEFASEMIVKASLHKMEIREVPTKLSKDGRDRKPHLRTWRDGWRHLKFLLLLSPSYLFLYPGLVMMILGSGFGIRLGWGEVSIGNVNFDIHTMLLVSASVIIGLQLIVLGLMGLSFSIDHGFRKESLMYERFMYVFKLELGIILGLVMICIGGLIVVFTLGDWGDKGFGDLDPQIYMRKMIFAMTLFVMGFQVVFSSFMFELLRLPVNRNK